MIHITPEGSHFKLGLNVWVNLSVKRFWARLVWCWFNPIKEESVTYYFRVRLFRWPFFIFNVNRWNRIQSYLFETNQFLITKEQYEDYIPRDKQ